MSPPSAPWRCGVVLDAPVLGQDLGFQESVELLGGEEFVAEAAVEGLAVAVAGERDAGHVADPAVRAVAAHKVSGGHPVRPGRAAHVRGHRGVVLVHPDHLVSAAYVGAEFAGAFVEQALESRLWELQRLQRGICQVCEVQMHTAERESGSRAGVGAGCFESFQRASVVQQLQDLPAEIVGLRGVSGLRSAERVSARSVPTYIPMTIGDRTRRASFVPVTPYSKNSVIQAVTPQKMHHCGT